MKERMRRGELYIAEGDQEMQADAIRRQELVVRFKVAVGNPARVIRRL